MIIAVDTEDTSLRYSEMKLLGVTICRKIGNDYDCHYYDFALDVDSLAFGAVQTIIKQADLVALHHASFDLNVLHKFGFGAPRAIFDTQVAAHLIDENRGYGLKALAQELLGVEKPLTFIQASEEGYHSSKFYDYARLDGMWTYQLYELFEPLLREQKLDGLFYEIEMPFQFVLAEMERKGIKVDEDTLKGVHPKIKDDVDELVIEMSKILGLRWGWSNNLFSGERELIGANFASNPFLIEIFEKLKLPIVDKTEKGNFSVGIKTIERLRDQHPFVAKLAEWRDLQKLYTAFIQPLVGQIESDGYVRSSYKDCGTRIGRLSCANPNLQQLPREG